MHAKYTLRICYPVSLNHRYYQALDAIAIAGIKTTKINELVSGNKCKRDNSAKRFQYPGQNGYLTFINLLINIKVLLAVSIFLPSKGLTGC